MSAIDIICRVIGCIVGCVIVYAVIRELADTGRKGNAGKKG